MEDVREERRECLLLGKGSLVQVEGKKRYYIHSISWIYPHTEFIIILIVNCLLANHTSVYGLNSSFRFCSKHKIGVWNTLWKAISRLLNVSSLVVYFGWILLQLLYYIENPNHTLLSSLKPNCISSRLIFFQTNLLMTLSVAFLTYPSNFIPLYFSLHHFLYLCKV